MRKNTHYLQESSIGSHYLIPLYIVKSPVCTVKSLIAATPECLYLSWYYYNHIMESARSERIKKTGHMYLMTYYCAIKKNKIISLPGKWAESEVIMSGKMSSI